MESARRSIRTRLHIKRRSLRDWLDDFRVQIGPSLLEIPAEFPCSANVFQVDGGRDVRLLAIRATSENSRRPIGDHRSGAVGLVCANDGNVIAKHGGLDDEVLDAPAAAIDPHEDLGSFEG